MTYQEELDQVRNQQRLIMLNRIQRGMIYLAHIETHGSFTNILTAVTLALREYGFVNHLEDSLIQYERIDAPHDAFGFMVNTEGLLVIRSLFPELEILKWTLESENGFTDGWMAIGEHSD